MRLFKQPPPELAPMSGIVVLFYGKPGAGGSTIACPAPSSVMTDTHRGVCAFMIAQQEKELMIGIIATITTQNGKYEKNLPF